MWRHPIIKLLAAIYVAWGAWSWYLDRPVRAPDGVLAPAEPLQVDVHDGESLRTAGWTLRVRAHYTISARVLGLQRYRFDALSKLIPEDLALGWGPMSDNAILNKVEISQSNRFYYWHVANFEAISREAIIAHSANTHVIPENAYVARELSRLRRGQVVTLTGDLVDAARDDGFRITTSMQRTDTGAGACEVMLVREVAVEP